MTKADLVEQAAEAVGPRVPKRDCGLVVDAFLDAVKDALARGDHIELRGFGTFKLRHRKARTGRNPKTGGPVEVPPCDVPVFKPSSVGWRSLVWLSDLVGTLGISPRFLCLTQHEAGSAS